MDIALGITAGLLLVVGTDVAVFVGDRHPWALWLLVPTYVGFIGCGLAAAILATRRR